MDESTEDFKLLLLLLPDCPLVVILSVACVSRQATGGLGGGTRFFTAAAAATSTGVDSQTS